MDCIHCEVGLEQQYASGITIDVCPGCDSIWFDRGELELFKLHTDRERLGKLHRSSEFAETSPITLDCPKCGTDTLVMGEIEDYQAGRCSKCLGFWVIQKKSLGSSPLDRALDAVIRLVRAGW